MEVCEKEKPLHDAWGNESVPIGAGNSFCVVGKGSCTVMKVSVLVCNIEKKRGQLGSFNLSGGQKIGVGKGGYRAAE